MSLSIYKKCDLAFIKALTPLHIGTGRTAGLVDLPVQRDAFGFPYISSHSLRQPIRSLMALSITDQQKRREIIEPIFGPEEIRSPEEAFAGAFNVLDAKLLTIPARSMIGLWTYITGPFCLREFKRYLELTNSSKFSDLVNIINNILEKLQEENVLYTTEDNANRINVGVDSNIKQALLNDEFLLKISTDASNEISELIKKLNRYGINEVKTFGFSIVNSDDLFREIVERSIIKITRIRIDYKRKTVRTGGLWTEELIPEYTIFYSLFLYMPPRVPKNFPCRLSTASDVECQIKEHLKKFKNVLFIGGHETVGRGLVELKFV